jgi:hypothetical protein
LRTLAVVARFAGRTRAVFAKRPIAEPFTGCSLIGLARAAIGGLNDVARRRHLFLAAALRYRGQPIDRQRQKDGQKNK